MRKLFFRVYAVKARVNIDTFYSNQTILQFSENWIDDLSTLTFIFSAIASATSSSKASLERQKTLYNILKFEFPKLY